MAEMNILFDEERLRKLIANLNVLTGLPANILDPEGRDINLFKGHPPFCRMLNDLPEGHQRCVACDRCKIQHYTAEKGFQFYRCHAGICEAIMPLFDKKRPLAYLAFGCYLDETPMEEQWEVTRSRLDWYPGGAEALRPAFFQFRQYSQRELRAYAETLEALSSYIQLKGMILTAEQTDLQKLELYLDRHYMEKLSLASVSQELRIGRTKLCALACCSKAACPSLWWGRWWASATTTIFPRSSAPSPAAPPAPSGKTASAAGGFPGNRLRNRTNFHGSYDFSIKRTF